MSKYGIPDILAVLKGCVLAQPNYWPLPRPVCDATPEQLRIFEFIRRRYPLLRLSRPLPKGDDDHHRGSKATDWIAPLSVPPDSYHPSVYAAFAALLKSDFPGGVGIGYLQADPHLHVDLRGRRLRWIEIDKPSSSKRWLVKSTDKDFPLYNLTCAQAYGVDWPGDVPTDPGFYRLSGLDVAEFAAFFGLMYAAIRFSR